jgi:hypothetical protein
MMNKFFVAFAGVAVAAAGLAAAPAQARHYTNRVACTRWHNHRCVSWQRLTRAQVRRRAAWRMGHVFGPNYGYTAYNALPHPYVVRYHLNPDYRYVYNGGYIYVVDPTTYAITRVLQAF